MIWKISALLMLLATPLAALDCGDEMAGGTSYTICSVDMERDILRLFLHDDAGDVYGNFRDLPGTVRFAMNAGMFHEDRAPVGYYQENGRDIARLITRAGPGNFGMVPNGVFCFGNGEMMVMETIAFSRANRRCDNATQSGPMLVIDGELHPRFFAASTSRNIRNGVGVSTDGQTAHFVISNDAVNFHRFASFFRDTLGVDNALYFDGRVSRLHAPSLNRSDFGVTLGPIIAVVD